MVVADSSTVILWVSIVGIAVMPAAVNFAKGKFWWGLFSVVGVLGLFAVGAAIRLARPDSWWARKLYDEKTMARARKRFAASNRAGRLELVFWAAVAFIILACIWYALGVGVNSPPGS